MHLWTQVHLAIYRWTTSRYDAKRSEGGKDSRAEGQGNEGYSKIAGILEMGAQAKTTNGERIGRLKEEPKENKRRGDGA